VGERFEPKLGGGGRSPASYGTLTTAIINNQENMNKVKQKQKK